MRMNRTGMNAAGLLATVAMAAAIMAPVPALADEAKADLKVTPLMQQALPDLPGKEGMLVAVEFAPGYSDKAHRHDAHVFVYVIEGTVEMQVAGGKKVTLKAGDTFYENPDDVHTVTTNLSKTKPAKFLAFFVKNQNTPPVLPPK